MAKEKKPEVVSEHVYTIPLSPAWKGTGRITRTKRSVSAVRRFIIRHTRAKDVRISQKLNTALWGGGAKRPPGKVRVKASVDAEGLASVKLPGEITLEEEKKKFLAEKKAAEKKPDRSAPASPEKPGEAGHEEAAEKPEPEKGKQEAGRAEKAPEPEKKK